MNYRPGDTFHVSVFTSDPDTLALTNASALSGLLRRNGVDTATAAAFTNHAAGDYTASATIPADWALDDEVELIITATVNGYTRKRASPLGRLVVDPYVLGVVTAASSGASFTGSGLAAEDDFYNQGFLVFLTGANAKRAGKVDDYTAAGVLTFAASEAFPHAPAVGDRFMIIGRAG